MIIYQIFTRLFGNSNTTNLPAGSLADNGCGKMSFYTTAVLNRIKKLESLTSGLQALFVTLLPPTTLLTAFHASIPLL